MCEKLHGCTYSIIPDQIEAGSYMVAAAATGGDVLIKNVTPSIWSPLPPSCAVPVPRWKSSTMPCGYAVPATSCPEDQHYAASRFSHRHAALMGVLLSVAKGTSTVTESVWDNRFRYVDELRKMGASVQVDGQVAVFEGVESSARLRCVRWTCVPVPLWWWLP